MNHPTSDFLFISGWGATERVWDRFLAESPGIRASHVNWSDCARDWPQAVARALDRLSGPSCVLVGWSLGGLFALRAALEYPDRISKLVLISGTARMCEAEGYPGADPRVLRAMRSRLTRDPGRVLSEFAALCVEPDGDATTRAEYLEMAHTLASDALSRGLEALSTLDLRERLGEIAVPALLLHGSHDTVIPLKSAVVLASQLPNARLEVLEGRGHALPLTAAEEMAQAIGRFLT